MTGATTIDWYVYHNRTTYTFTRCLSIPELETFPASASLGLNQCRSCLPEAVLTPTRLAANVVPKKTLDLIDEQWLYVLAMLAVEARTNIQQFLKLPG